jgi:hypothetical protein
VVTSQTPPCRDSSFGVGIYFFGPSDRTNQLAPGPVLCPIGQGDTARWAVKGRSLPSPINTTSDGSQTSTRFFRVRQKRRSKFAIDEINLSAFVFDRPDMEVSIPKCEGVFPLSPAFMLEIDQFIDALQSATTASQTSYWKLQMALDLEFLQKISTGSAEPSLHLVLSTRTPPPHMKSPNFTKRPILSGSW